MSACLYCGKEAGPTGLHPSCAPRKDTAAAPVVAVRESPAERVPSYTPPPPAHTQRVRVVDVDMPFMSMVNFMVKWALASIPAFLILGLLGAIIFAIIGGLAGR